jgi:hypothetical protein
VIATAHDNWRLLFPSSFADHYKGLAAVGEVGMLLRDLAASGFPESAGRRKVLATGSAAPGGLFDRAWIDDNADY